MAGPYLDQATAVAVEKDLYDGQRVRDMAFKDNPALAMMKKNTNAGGRVYPMPLLVSPGQGGSAQFSVAQQNQTPPQAAAFQVVNLPYYGLGSVQRQTILSMKTDRMAFINALEMATNSALSDITNSISGFMYKMGTGSVAQISSISASGLITLTYASDSVFFERRRALQANSTDGGATPRAQQAYVTAVNRQAGTVQVSMTLDGPNQLPTGWVANDFLLRQGDNNAVPPGFQAILPVTAPVAGQSFMGVDRSSDSRLYGVLGPFAGESIQEAAVDHSLLIDREGGTPRHWLMNLATWGALAKELGTKVMYEPVKAEDADISFSGIQVHGAKAPITAIQDRNCPAQAAFMIQLDTWELVSIGDVPHIQGLDDGEEFFRMATADARELRTSAYWGMMSGAPGWNGQTQTAQ